MPAIEPPNSDRRLLKEFLITLPIGVAAPTWRWCWTLEAAAVVIWYAAYIYFIVKGLEAHPSDLGAAYIISYIATKTALRASGAFLVATLGHAARRILTGTSLRSGRAATPREGGRETGSKLKS